LLLGSAHSLAADVSVLTQHNDLARTGANLQETLLNTANVNSNRFGLLATREVDDQIYAQPLVVSGVSLPGLGKRSLVIVATVNDSVYAFDADNAAAAGPCWKVNFLGPNAVAPTAADMDGACGGEYKDFSGNIGIVGTPVIEPSSQTLFLVARTKEYGTNYVQRLHALDISTGAERPHSPVELKLTYPGHGDGHSHGILALDPQRANQRSGLALVNGIVFVGWSSHCDWGPYHGWLAGYDAKTLERVAVYNTTPEGYNGGIWMSGQAPAADGRGNLYLSVGNGSVGTSGNPADPVNRGESLLRLEWDGKLLHLTDWFTPSNWQDLENTDNDFGNSGVLLIPGTALAFCGTKEGRVYLINCEHMGKLSHSKDDPNIVQSFQVSSPGSSFGLFAAPVWWEGPDASWAYLWCKEDSLRQYKFDRGSGKFDLPESARSAGGRRARMPGGVLAVSANGKQGDSGIVWASHALNNDANHVVSPGILRAFRATNISEELWNSEQVKTRDAVGHFAKFVPPVIANGKVYLATFSNRLNIYGLLSNGR
jgi:hypothetical protein